MLYVYSYTLPTLNFYCQFYCDLSSKKDAGPKQSFPFSLVPSVKTIAVNVSLQEGITIMYDTTNTIIDERFG